MINPCAWAQAASNEGQSFWTFYGLVTDVPLQQVVIARISHVTSSGSRHAWDPLRVVYLARAKERRFEVVLELPQSDRDLSGRHVLVSVHALIREYEMHAAATAITDVLGRNERVEVRGGTPDDLAQRLTELAARERSLRIRMRRSLARR